MATLAELQTYCQRHGWRDSTTAGTTQLAAWINDVLKFLAIERRWPFYETPGYFNLTAPYTTGTVAMTAASTALVGTTTTWAAGMAGQEFWTTEDGNRVYMIATFTDTTHLTLNSAYLGATASGKTYSIRYVRYAAPSDWGQEGVFYLEDGRELSYEPLELSEWHRLRLLDRGTTSYPERIMHHNLAGTDYFYIDPAPSVAKAIRYTYWRVPATLTSGSDAADIPASFRGLLHLALRLRLSVDDNNAGLEAMQTREYQREIDKTFVSQQPHGPLPIRVGGGRAGGKVPLGGLGNIFRIDSGYD